VCGEAVHEIGKESREWIKVTTFHKMTPKELDFFFCSESCGSVWLKLGTSAQNTQILKVGDIFRRIKAELALEDLKE
jgi:hypothetical protein